MFTEKPKTIAFEKNLELETLVRNEVKSLFDKKPNNDPLYHVYSTIDNIITSKFAVLDPKETATQKDILRIVEFFNTFHFFESMNDFIKEAYMNSNRFRHGFLTNGMLLRTIKIDGELKVEMGYTMPDLTKIYTEQPELYKNIVNEIEEELHGSISIDSGEKWYFWPGCEMKIPADTNIILDPSISKPRFVISEEVENNEITIEEVPYKLEISSTNNNKWLVPGLTVIKNTANGNTDFSEVELELNNKQISNYTLYLPYNSPRCDMKTQVKIFNGKNHVEEFVATCT